MKEKKEQRAIVIYDPEIITLIDRLENELNAHASQLTIALFRNATKISFKGLVTKAQMTARKFNREK
jgi:hypothetical protein